MEVDKKVKDPASKALPLAAGAAAKKMIKSKKATAGKKPVAKKSAGKKPVGKKSSVKKPVAKTAAKVPMEGDEPPKEEVKKIVKRKPKRTVILTGKYKPPHTLHVVKQLFLGNLPAAAGEKEVMVLLRRWRHYIRSVRVLRNTGSGKKATKDKDGKVVPRSRRVAFVRLRTTAARNSILKVKNLTIDGNVIRVEKSRIKKAHIAKMAAQKARKKENYLKKKELKKVIKEQMYQNLLKNQKRAKNLKKKLSKKKSATKKTPRAPKEGEKQERKLKLVKRQVFRTAERRKLSGQKARKAMARMTRK